MKAPFFIATGIATLLLTGTGAVQAQEVTNDVLPVQKPFRIKLGGFFPTESALREDFGNTFFSYGASWDFAKSTGNNPTIYSVYYDGWSKSKDVGGFDSRLTSNGIGASLRYSITPPVLPTRFYAGAGLGVYFLNAKKGVDFNGVRRSESENKTQLGGKIFGGVELNQGFFGEADFTYINDVFDTNVSGFGLSVGYRF